MGGYLLRLGLPFSILIVAFIGFQGLAHAAPYAYITNELSSTVSVIDLETNIVTATIDMGSFPCGVAVNPAGTKVYISNPDADSISVIDVATNTVTATINVGNFPNGVAVNPAGTKVYVANYKSDSISVIDTATNLVTSTIPVGQGPWGVAVNPAGTKVYVTNSDNDSVSVIDTATNRVTSTIIIWNGPLSWNPMGVAVNPTGTNVYVANIFNDSVSVIDLSTDSVIDTIKVGSHPVGVAINPTGTKVYVTNQNSNSVYVIDTATNIVTATINVGDSPEGVAVNHAGTNIYVVNYRSGTVSVIDSATNIVIAIINVGTGPNAFGQFISNNETTPLTVLAEPISVRVSTPTNVIFKVTSNDITIDGANITLTGNATGYGTTNATGIAILSVNASSAGTITATAGMTGFKNGTITLMAYIPIATPTPIPTPESFPASTPFPSARLSNNSTISLAGVTSRAAPPVASIVISAGILAFWTLIEKLLLFLFSGVKGYLQGVYSTIEKKIRKVEVVQRIPLLFGLSSLEILVVVVSALLLGGAFAYARDELWILQGFLVIVVVAGFTSVIHELAHWYAAHHFKKDVEYKFWGLGTLTLILTTLLHYPFSSPSRTLVNNSETLDKRTLGIISLAGPLVSIVLSILFLLLIAYDHGLEGIGVVGFNLGMMTCVYQLMPIKPLEGVRVFEWNKLIWGVVFIPCLVFYLMMLTLVL